MKEQRDSYRFRVNEGQVHIKSPFIGTDGRVLDISASGAALALSVWHRDTLQNSPIVFEFLNQGDIETRADLVRFVEKDNLVQVGIRFLGMRQDTRQTFCQFLTEQFIDTEQSYPLQDHHKLKIANTNANNIRRLIQYNCIVCGRPLDMNMEGNPLPLRFTVQGFSKKAGLQLLILRAASSDKDLIKEGKSYKFSFSGSTALNYFVSDVWEKTAEALLITLPSVIYQDGFRDSTRCLPEPHHEVKFDIKHPKTPETVLSKTILEFGVHGFSFPFEPKADCLFPGERIPNVRFYLPEGQVEAEGAIRNVRKNWERFNCGFEILRFKNDSHEARWKQYVLQSTYRRLMISGGEDASTVWAVLESSKYTDFVVPHLRERLKRHFFKTWKKHAENPRAFISINLFEKDKPISTCAANLLYPGTFLGHHLSIDQGIRKDVFDISREICSGMSFVLHHMVSSGYFVCFVDAFKNLTRIFYGRFLDSYPVHEDFIYDRHHVYKGWPESQMGDNPTLKGPIRVVPATGALLDQLSGCLKQNVSDLEFRSYSYDRDNLTLELFSKACQEDGYEMKREIFFAVENKTPLAALIAEAGDEAMNLFSLLNTCRIIFLRPEAKEDDRVYEVLLHQAMEFYRRRKKPEFIFYLEYDEDNKKSFDKFGLKYVTDVMRFLGRTNILSAHLNYLDESLGIRHQRLKFR